MKFVDADLPCPNLAEEDVYGGGGGEDFRGRREYDGDEVEAVKLFLTGDDAVATALGFGSSSGESEIERGKGSEDGDRGIYSHGEKLLVRRFRTNVPLAVLLLTTFVTHVLCSGDRVRSWVSKIMQRGMRNGLSGKIGSLDKISFNVSFAISSADKDTVK